jgi:hypothetical protein
MSKEVDMLVLLEMGEQVRLKIGCWKDPLRLSYDNDFAPLSILAEVPLPQLSSPRFMIS